MKLTPPKWEKHYLHVKRNKKGYWSNNAHIKMDIFNVCFMLNQYKIIITMVNECKNFNTLRHEKFSCKKMALFAVLQLDSRW